MQRAAYVLSDQAFEFLWLSKKGRGSGSVDALTFVTGEIPRARVVYV